MLFEAGAAIGGVLGGAQRAEAGGLGVGDGPAAGNVRPGASRLLTGKLVIAGAQTVTSRL